MHAPVDERTAPILEGVRVVRSRFLVALALAAACSGDDHTDTRAEISLVTWPRACQGEDVLHADVDGDRFEDRAYHRWRASASEARLGVCTSTGLRDETEGAGQAEGVFEAFDVESDGRFELAFGATTANQTLTSIAVFFEGQLEVVTVPEAGPLVLAEGPVDETTGEAWGCEPPAAGEAGRLVQVRVRHLGPEADWTRTSYKLNGATARQVDVEIGKEPAQQTPTRHAGALVPLC